MLFSRCKRRFGIFPGGTPRRGPGSVADGHAEPVPGRLNPAGWAHPAGGERRGGLAPGRAQEADSPTAVDESRGGRASRGAAATPGKHEPRRARRLRMAEARGNVTARSGAPPAKRAGTIADPRYYCHVPAIRPDERSNRFGGADPARESPGGVTSRARQTFISGCPGTLAPSLPAAARFGNSPARTTRRRAAQAAARPARFRAFPPTSMGPEEVRLTDWNVRRSSSRERSLYLSDSSLKEDLT